MREPFFDTRTVVVLYREPWGQTPWTGVEETAIGERCLRKGWPGLVFVNLDRTSTNPRWLPTTQVRFSMQDYGIDQLVGVIKARVQEHGGRIVPLDAMSAAKRVQREAQYIADRDRLMSDRSWIENKVHSSLRATMDEVVDLADRANAEHGFDISAGAQDMSCIVRSGFVSVATMFRQPIFNRVSDYGNEPCYLRVAEYSGLLRLPSERGYGMHSPQQLKEHKFKVDVSEARDLIWKEVGKREHIAPDQLADRIMQIFLDLLSRANRGKVQRAPFSF